MRELAHRVFAKLSRKLGQTARKLGDGGRFEVAGIDLEVDPTDPGGLAYRSRDSFEFASDRLLADIATQLKPEKIIDIGANYGFTAVALSRIMGGVPVVAVEPSSHLEPYLRRNLERNDVAEFELLRAVCDADPSGDVTFALNPNGSQDNRVNAGGAGWSEETVGRTSIDELLSDWPDARPVFIKVDTQGFEQRVFDGAEAALGRLGNWAVKTEFAPDWLRAQDTDPVALLAGLAESYRVCEWPARPRFQGDTLESLSSAPLDPADAAGFVAFVEALNGLGGHKKGWCDLLIVPR